MLPHSNYIYKTDLKSTVHSQLQSCSLTSLLWLISFGLQATAAGFSGAFKKLLCVYIYIFMYFLQKTGWTYFFHLQICWRSLECGQSTRTTVGLPLSPTTPKCSHLCKQATTTTKKTMRTTYEYETRPRPQESKSKNQSLFDHISDCKRHDFKPT